MSSNQNLLEKLEYRDEKNILIQGLPSSLEKQFLKLTFSKNVTPLLKTKKVDFALVFAINNQQLNKILDEVLTAFKENTNFWIAFPKSSSKIISDLNRDNTWDYLTNIDFKIAKLIDLDHVWGAYKFHKKGIDYSLPVAAESQQEYLIADSQYKIQHIPFELEKLLDRNEISKRFFMSLTASEQKKFIDWIFKAKKKETQEKRIIAILDKLRSKKRSPIKY